MKKYLRLLIALALVVSLVTVYIPTNAEKVYADDNVYYHLDTGVYVVPYLSGKPDISTDYIGAQRPITASINFPTNIQVLDVYPAVTATSDGESLLNPDFKIGAGPSNGIYTYNTKSIKNLSYIDSFGTYYLIHMSTAQTKPVLNTAKTKNNHVEFTYKATLDSQKLYDVAQAYRGTCDTTTEIKNYVETTYKDKTISNVDKTKATQLSNRAKLSYRVYSSVAKKHGKYSFEAKAAWKIHTN